MTCGVHAAEVSREVGATGKRAQRVSVTEIRQRARPDQLTRGPAVSAPIHVAGLREVKTEVGRIGARRPS
jgi:hypothetical protein